MEQPRSAARWERAPPRDGLRFLIVSGWAYPASSMEALAAALSGSGEVVVVTPGSLGARALPCPDAAVPPDFPYAGELQRMIQAHDGPTVLVGWSLGGMIAMEACARIGGAVAALAAAGATPKFCTGPGYTCGTPPAAVRAMAQGLDRHPHRILQEFFTTAALPHPADDRALASIIEESLADGKEDLLAGLRYLRQTDLRNVAARVKVPTLILHGQPDRIVPCAAARCLADLIPGSRALIVDDAGHDLPVRKSEETARAIREFLEDVM